MENYCAFSKNHKYLNWTDYKLTRYEQARRSRLFMPGKLD